MTLARIRSIARQCQRREGLDVVVVDYITLIASEGGGQNRTLEVGKISTGLKNLAKELQVPVIVLEKAIIWPAVEAWLARNKVGFTGRLPKVRLSRANGFWWCRSESHPWAGAGDSPAQAYRSWSRAVSIQARKDGRPNEILHVWSAE
jgi:hypothetical protein